MMKIVGWILNQGFILLKSWIQIQIRQDIDRQLGIN